MMPHLSVLPHGDGAWPDLAAKDVAHVQTFAVAGLPAGMASGAPSVMLRLDLPDGRVVLAETSLKLFLSAADALRVAHGDPR